MAASATSRSVRPSPSVSAIAASLATPPVGSTCAGSNTPGVTALWRSSASAPLSPTVFAGAGTVMGETASRSGLASPFTSPATSTQGSAATA